MKHADQVKQALGNYGNSIYRLCYYLLQSEQDAQDALQETLIRYMDKAPQFNSAEHEKAWLLKVANHICMDILRFRRREKLFGDEEWKWLEQQTGEDEIAQDRKELIQLIFSLKEKYRNVIYLYYYEEYRIKEIAAILKISEAAVKKRLERGREFLKECLQEVSDER